MYINLLLKKMAKLYIKKTLATSKMLPKRQTIDFIINYSKALSIVKIEYQNFEIIAN